MEVSLTTYAANSHALRIRGAAEASRVPTHFIILLDNSGSMDDSEGSIFGRSNGADSKMDYVKRCLGALLACLSADDMLSIITFESTSTIHLQCMTVSEAHKAHIQSVIDGIYPQDMTNLSAGLGSVRRVLETAPAELKTGILLLTDGHINQGITDPTALKAIIHDILASRAGISLHCVGYGTDHNDELLKDISIETQGSYNIVKKLEDVATAFGDTLGGLMSCVAQNVEAVLPAGAVVQGPFKIRSTGAGSVAVAIGDLYAGTERIILYSAPSASGSGASAIVNAMVLPLLTPVKNTVEAIATTERCIDIELTHHRYTCTSLLQRIKESHHDNTTLRTDIDTYATAVADPAYNSSPITAQLRAEVDIMCRSLEAHAVGIADDAVLSQHISYYGLGRGFCTPSRPPRRTMNPTWAPVRRTGASYESDDESVAEENPTATTAIFQNHAQRMVSNTMRSMSSNPRNTSSIPYSVSTQESP
jgi:Mg-chelatase subunit ChlD